jgi:hypothetical protein
VVVVVGGGIVAGGVDNAVGVASLTHRVAVGGLKPAALWARTRKAYDVPLVNPLMRTAVPAGAQTRVHALPVHRSTT